jgi:drug/metabolite transporter (DMT)-like permease
MSINWVTYAVLSTAVLGFISVFEAHMVQRRMPGWRSFLLGISLFIFAYTIVLLFIVPVPRGAGTEAWIAAVAAGVLRGTAFAIIMQTMQREEVTRVVPVIGTYPVFVALFAIPLLGERLSGLQWLAVALAVGGAVLVSLKRDGRRRGAFISGTFWKLVAAAILLALSDVGNKYALELLPVWNVYAISTFFLAVVFSTIALRRSVLREIWEMPQRGRNIFLVFLNVAVSALGTWMLFEALGRGPVSLVSAVAGSRLVFVFVYGILLGGVVTRYIDWDKSRLSLLIRFSASLMIVGGIALIYLN